jgi:hypothetical protein
MYERMNKQELADFLLENAGESIKYRLHHEILGTPTDDPMMLQLQERIVEQRRVRKIFSYQHADGWIGDNIHGGIGTGLDGSVFTLREYGVDANNVDLQRAKHALLHPGANEPYRRNFPGGNLLDRDDHGGVRFFTALILASLEAENEPLVQEQIGLALECFESVLNVSHLDEVSVKKRIRNYENARYFIEGKMFPGFSHYAILAHTASWRTPENRRMLIRAINHTINLKPGEAAFFVKEKSRVIGLAGGWEHLLPDCGFNLRGVSFMFWLRELERFCRLGIAKSVPRIGSQVVLVEDFVKNPDILERLSEDQLSSLKRYARLEVSWRKEKQILCDLHFKFLLISHYGDV